MSARKIDGALTEPYAVSTNGYGSVAEEHAVRITHTGSIPGTRTLASEVPVALEFDGTPYAVMMLSPADLEDFAVGFALAERIIASAGEIARIDIRYGSRGIGIDVRLEKEYSQLLTQRLNERRRSIPGQSGCGLCGLTSIEETLPQLPRLSGAPALQPQALFRALAALAQWQVLNRETGAVHAASFCAPDGEILAVREDVGRHNAFDKIVGHLQREALDPASGFALLTSRCSYELVQKAVLARIPILATISAPTELAVSIARETDLTLVALARADSVLLFNDPFHKIVK
jgi:FdhD protein